MEIAPYWLILLIPICGSLGYLGGALGSIRFHRRCTKLEYLVGDIEDRLNTVRAKTAAKAKWDQKKWEDEALAHEHREPATVKRFDNDPL